MPHEEVARAAYQEQGAEIRHYSTVRSALTVFLLTVSLGAFSAFFNQAQSHPFMLFAGFLAMLAAIFACLHFSYRTEKAVLRYVNLWNQITAMQGAPAATIPTVIILKPPSGKIWPRVAADVMNWLLLIAAVGILVAFCLRDHLGPFLQAIHVL